MGLWYVLRRQRCIARADSSFIALFVTKWVHAVELDALNNILTSPAEAQLLDSMKQVLDETDCSFREGLSLAAALARLWSLSLQDVSENRRMIYNAS